jgi:prepilin-type processing-associated H-X9-DG protein
VQKVREAAARLQCLNNFRQLGLAFHNYQSAHKGFPPGWMPGLHSHVPPLLPYIEQNNVLTLLNLSLPFDDPLNKTATAQVLPILICPSNPEGGTQAINDYPVSDSIGAPAHLLLGVSGNPNDAQSQGFFARGGRKVNIAEISDGLSNTFMAFEDVGRPQFYANGSSLGGQMADHWNWADPENRITIQVVCHNKVINCHNGNEIFSFHTGGANFLFGDGSAHFIRDSLAPATFKALYTRAAGDVPGDW